MYYLYYYYSYYYYYYPKMTGFLNIHVNAQRALYPCQKVITPKLVKTSQKL